MVLGAVLARSRNTYRNVILSSDIRRLDGLNVASLSDLVLSEFWHMCQKHLPFGTGTVKAALGFPDDYRVVVVFALGYEEDPKIVWDELDERMRSKVEGIRTRKPATENFFFGFFREGD